VRSSLVSFGAIMLATLLAALDQTIVATALPQIVTDLQGFEHLSWVVTAYLVASTVTIPLYGKLSDLYGRRLLFMVSIVLFVLGSALCGAAGTMGQLIAFRALQGLGAGGLIPLAQATIADLFSPRERGKYQGYVTSMWGIAAVAGPLVGGSLTDAISWRWIFYVNVPLGLIALLVVMRTLPRSQRTEHRIDYLGAGILGASITAILLASVWGGTTYPWGSVEVLGCAIGGLLGIVVFIFVERRASEPVLPLGLFRNRVFTVSVSALFVVGALVFAISIYMPIYLQGVLGDSATVSGLTLIGFTGAWVVTATVTGNAISRTGRYRIFPIVGSILVTIGLVIATQFGTDTSHLVIAVLMILPGIGMGLSLQAYVVGTQNAVQPSQIGTATAALNFFRAIGGSLAVAGLGTLLANRVADELGDRLGARADLVNIDKVLQGGDVPVRLQGATASALSSALHSVWLVTAIIAIAGIVLALALEERRLRTDAPASAPMPE
jgi:EmrB/QacA subfamily drug resistance transporter